MSSSAGSSASPTVVQWVLDTRNLWPEATKTSQLSDVVRCPGKQLTRKPVTLTPSFSLQASRALDLLTEDERTNVLRYYFVKDAKLALGSILLKRHAVARFCGVPWAEAVITRDARSKPIYRARDGSQPLLFNVSHQAGLVVLFAVHNPPPTGSQGDDAEAFAIGVDVVCPSERRQRDHDMIARDGWPRYVDMHADVFSPGETARLKALPFAGGTDKMLAYFYALWCLREAYVKMTGEALLAKWLRELELRGFAPPGEAPESGESTGLVVWFQGRSVQGVDVRLSWLLGEYMVSTVVRRSADGQGVEVGEFTPLDIEEVLAAAWAAR